MNKKLCIDCKYCRKVIVSDTNSVVYYECTHTHNISLVDGTPEASCFMCRTFTDKCSPEAKWFEPKESNE